jgi:transposase InsO family protein
MSEGLLIPLPRDWKRRIQCALLCCVGLERLALAEVRAGFEQALDPRARLLAELDALREAHAVQAEELRICRARLQCLPPQERPHYPPAERLAILLLRARAGWNAAETARRFLVTPATIASWMKRLDERGSDALVKPNVPVNRFSDAVALLVQQLHQVAPGFGRRKLAQVLARAGVSLAASTARRLLQRRLPEAPAPPPAPREKTRSALERDERVVTAQRPHHVWHVDMTVVGIGAPGFGFWAPWWPLSLVLRWALSWHLAIVLDHFSRSFLAFAVFRKEPTAEQVCALLERAVEKVGAAPRYIITDRGAQFGAEYRAWCSRRGVRPRYGAVGNKGSIALVERFILSLKSEFLWKVFVPASHERMLKLICSYQAWYNGERPHSSLAGLMPAEVLAGGVPVRVGVVAPRGVLARGDPMKSPHNQLALNVTYMGGHPQLPIVRLRQAA